MKTTVRFSEMGRENLKAACSLSGQKTDIGAIEAALGFYVAFLRGGIEHVHCCPDDPDDPGRESWVKIDSRCSYCGWEPAPGTVPHNPFDG